MRTKEPPQNNLENPGMPYPLGNIWHNIFVLSPQGTKIHCLYNYTGLNVSNNELLPILKLDLYLCQKYNFS